jgi:hypothetical protein
MQGFMEYVAPHLASAGYVVAERQAIRPGPNENTVLISLVGPVTPERSLEGVLDGALVRARKDVDAVHREGHKDGRSDKSFTAWPH